MSSELSGENAMVAGSLGVDRAPPRPFRWAVRLRRAASGEEWRELARSIEDLGYDAVVMPDHVARNPLVGAQFAPVPALMAVAAATTRLRVGALVLANDFRDPVMLAREIATIDLLSAGRVDLGLGAGWSPDDYAALGRAFDPAQTRIERLEEALLLLGRLFTEERVDHAGTHYTVRGASVWPRPLQRPHPPFLVGGHSERVLSIAARHADIVSIGSPVAPTPKNISADRVRSRVDLVRSVASARFDTIRLHLQADVRVTAQAGDAYAETATRLGLPVADVRASPYFLYGSVDELTDRIGELRESYGIGYLRVTEDQATSVAPLIGRVR